MTPLGVGLRYAAAFAVAVLAGRLLRSHGAEIALVLPSAGVAALWFGRARTRAQVAVYAALQLVIGVSIALLTGAYLELGVVLTLASTVGSGATVVTWRGLTGGRERLQTLADGVALLAATAAGATVSTAVALALATLAGPPTSEAVGAATLLIPVRTGLGTFLVMAVAVAWRDARATRTSRTYANGAVDTSLTVACFVLLFALADVRVAAYAALPLTVLLAVHRGVLGTAWHLCVASVTTVALMLVGVGPFPITIGPSAALVAQGFLSVLTLVGLGLALLRSEQRAALEAAATTAARLRRTVDSALIAHVTVTVHPDGRVDVVRANPAACAFFGVPAEQLVGRSLLDHVVPHHRLDALAALLAVRGGAPSWSGELEYDLGERGHRWATVSAAPMDAADDVDVDGPEAPCGAASVSLQLMDVTERKEAQTRLAHLATHDPLTDLANRALLTRAVEDALAAASTAVVLVDLDRFKQVNDALGHAAGDAVLVETARRLRAAARVGDTVARLGGDEFVLCCPGVDSLDEARRIADRVTQALAEPLVLDGVTVDVGASVGVTLSAEHSTADTLLAESDAAMYEVKRAGRLEPAR